MEYSLYLFNGHLGGQRIGLFLVILKNLLEIAKMLLCFLRKFPVKFSQERFLYRSV